MITSVCVCACVCAQIQGTVSERLAGFAALSFLSDIIVLSYVSKVADDDTGCKSSLNA